MASTLIGGTYFHLNPQIPSLSLSIPSSSFTFHSTPKRLFPKFLTSSSLSSSNNNFNNYPDEDEEEEEEEEDEPQVIGDCLVFEDGIFDTPFPQPQQQQQFVTKRITHKKPKPEIQPDNLVPEEWTQVVEELNLTKKDKRKLAQEAQFGQRIFGKKKTNSYNVEEYLRYKEYKLSQLKPLVLDDPPEFSSDEGHKNHVRASNSERVEPKNPRWAVYGRGLDDISDFFNSASYQSADDKSQGRQKLLTKEEKVLINARKPTLEIATSLKWLPLHTLTASGEFYLLNILLKYEVDINAGDQDGLTALHKAIICKKQAITNYLLRESANAFVRDKDGATLMHYAVQTASSHAIKTLVLYNVDISVQDNDGWTPLHVAVQARRTDVVRLLLKKGADKTLKNKDGLTPLEVCLHSGRDVRTYELIKLLKLKQLSRQRR